MNSGGNTLGIGKIDPKTNRVAPLANTTNAGSSVIAGKGNTNTALQGSLIIGGENNTLSASSNATSNSIIF